MATISALAAKVIEHMHTHCPGTPAGEWVIGQNPDSPHVHVVWQPGTMGFGQAGVRGTMLWRWQNSLKDAGFVVEARTDESVFGRPDRHSNIACWVNVTGFDAGGAVRKPTGPAPAARPVPPAVRTVPLRTRPADLKCPVTGQFPQAVTFTYRASGVVVQAEYAAWAQGIPAPAQWLLDLAETHRPAA